jgi:hypothetical protein
MDPDPAIFVIDLQDASKKLIFNTTFYAYYFLKVHLHHFSKIKVKKSHKLEGIKVFLLFMHVYRRIREAQKHVNPLRIRNTGFTYLEFSLLGPSSGQPLGCLA